MGPYGAPVYFPQQPDMPVYHNRAIWPFVSAYGLKAAAMVQNVAVVDHHIDSLMRSAALNLQHGEPRVALRPTLPDGSDPSRFDGAGDQLQRQLWSVGGYLGMVTDTTFGYKVEEGGIRIKPFVTAHLHKLMGARARPRSGGSTTVASRSISCCTCRSRAGGQLLSDTQYYPQWRPGGGSRSVKGMLAPNNRIEVTLGAAVADDQGIRLIKDVAPLDVENRRGIRTDRADPARGLASRVASWLLPCRTMSTRGRSATTSIGMASWWHPVWIVRPAGSMIWHCSRARPIATVPRRSIRTPAAAPIMPNRFAISLRSNVSPLMRPTSPIPGA